MQFKILALIFSFTLILFSYQTTTAQEASTEAKLKDIKYEQVNPGTFQYEVKRLKEKIKLFLLFSKEQKASYLSEILDRRYKELAYLVINNRIGNLENVVSRYNTTIGEIISSYKDVDPHLKNQIKDYPEVLGILRDKFKANSAQWLLIQYAIDTSRRLSS